MGCKGDTRSLDYMVHVTPAPYDAYNTSAYTQPPMPTYSSLNASLVRRVHVLEHWTVVPIPYSSRSFYHFIEPYIPPHKLT